MSAKYQRTMFHTQEKRRQRLLAPLYCNDEDAWLGEGYYFWEDEIDAIHWGNKKKRRTGYFEVYKADIDLDTSNLLDTVFNREHYEFWVNSIEKAAKVITKKTGKKPSLQEINEYFIEKGNWTQVKGILFQDIPINETLLVDKFYYRKRIQLAIFSLEPVARFYFYYERECIK